MTTFIGISYYRSATSILESGDFVYVKIKLLKKLI